MSALITETDHVWAALEHDDGTTVERFDTATLTGLPAPARQFLTAAIPDGAPLATGVELTMTGRIKLGIWLPFTARQILRAGVGFVWNPKVGRRLVRFTGADILGPDGARMQFRLHDRLTVVDASGPDVDRSAAGRLAAETVAWLPHVLTPQSGATWKPIDNDRATVTIVGPTGPVDVDVTIDDSGRLVDLGLQRWRDSAKPPANGSFGGTVSAPKTVNGVRIAGAGTVGWDWATPDQNRGEFFRYTITTARFLEPATTPPTHTRSTS